MRIKAGGQVHVSIFIFFFSSKVNKSQLMGLNLHRSPATWKLAIPYPKYPHPDEQVCLEKLH